MRLETLTDKQLAKMIAHYNGQRGTDKQVQKILKTSNREMMMNFLIPRSTASLLIEVA